MIRYVAISPRRRARACWDDDAPQMIAQVVHETLDDPVNTGLVDADGTPLYRISEKRPIGFMR